MLSAMVPFSSGLPPLLYIRLKQRPMDFFSLLIVGTNNNKRRVCASFCLLLSYVFYNGVINVSSAALVYAPRTETTNASTTTKEQTRSAKFLRSSNNITGVVLVDYPIPPPIIYGHVHMAKTAGTELNGILSMRYERICGHKGYSYDAISTGHRSKESGTTSAMYRSKDSFNQLVKGHNRGRVPPLIMDEIGFEDCDYISHETHWSFWTEPRMQNLWRDFPLELHVPCRDPIDHLLSSCNHRHHIFQCRPENDNGTVNLNFLRNQIRQCHGHLLARFSMQLDTNYPSIHVKCYDFRKQFNEYMEYMDRRLQKRRIEAEYFHRDTNMPRNKTAECLWTDDQARQAVSELLLKWDYYNFCNRCMGSENEI